MTELAEKYGETPIAAGITGNGTLLEIYSAPMGRTWTIVITDRTGTSCLASAGESLRRVVVDMGQES